MVLRNCLIVRASLVLIAEDLFFAEVGAIINEFHTKDDNQAAKFRQAATVARQRLFVLNAAKENVNRDYEMGT